MSGASMEAPRRLQALGALLVAATVLSASPVARAAEVGEACVTDDDCTSGFCVDDVCCDSACDGACVACRATEKESLSGTGQCGPALAGTDPHDDCEPEDASTCGQTGQCDGAGACALFVTGTPCGSTTCTLNNVTGMICDGAGSCYSQGAPLPCEPYVCDQDACQSPCGSTADCFGTGTFCEGGLCKPKRSAGTPCDGPASCASGHCVDGYCCDSGCTGQCEACNGEGDEGACLPVTGAPQGDRPSCGEGPCAGTCDGADRTACTLPDRGTECAPASCENGATHVLRPSAMCDGSGACEEPSPTDCTPYACDPDVAVCRTSCSIDGDCASGATCDVTTGQCVLVLDATCTDGVTLTEPSGTESSCTPYACRAGACLQQCSSDADCAPDAVCELAACVLDDGGGEGSSETTGESPTGDMGASDAGASGDSGCGCRAAPRGATRRGWGALFVASLAAGCRSLSRRRRLRVRSRPLP